MSPITQVIYELRQAVWGLDQAATHLAKAYVIAHKDNFPHAHATDEIQTIAEDVGSTISTLRLECDHLNHQQETPQ